MIIQFKLFERLGIEDIVVQISEKIFEEFKKHFNEKYAFENKSDSFIVDISEYLKDKKMNVTVNYNDAQSRSGYLAVIIGIIDRIDNEKIKTLEVIKQDILHEVKHNIDILRRFGRLDNANGFSDNKHRFLDHDNFKNLMGQDIIGSFKNSKSNIYSMKISILNFLKCDIFTEQYRKLLAYLYLCETAEFTARLHEFYNKIKNGDDFLKDQTYILFKDMTTFKLNYNDFSEIEKKKLSNIFKPQDTKKVEKYINKQSQIFIRKVHKLTAFNQEESIS